MLHFATHVDLVPVVVGFVSASYLLQPQQILLIKSYESLHSFAKKWFLSTIQKIVWEEHLRNDLFCVEWDVKPQLNQSFSVTK